VPSKLEKAAVNKRHNADEKFNVVWIYLKHKNKVNWLQQNALTDGEQINNSANITFFCFPACQEENRNLKDQRKKNGIKQRRKKYKTEAQNKRRLQ
jgi:hypothetical protein